MTIQILTRHPALMYVLNRTAPVGVTVRGKPVVRRGFVAVYMIDVETQMLERQSEAKVLGTWLPGYIQYYGAQRVAVNGRPVPFEEHQLRQILLKGKVSARKALRRDVRAASAQGPGDACVSKAACLRNPAWGRQCEKSAIRCV